jgi:putative tryptophan/tyrosine transport system substrate-binding protein
MKRREFIAGLGSAAAWPLAARGQQSGSQVRVVYVNNARDDPETQASLLAFRSAFQKFGWTDGRNISIDYNWTALKGRSPQVAAAEIVQSAPAIVLSAGTPMSNALRLATQTIPVVFVSASDPLGSGLVDSIARPSGNLTGFANYPFSIGGKWLEMLKQAAPAASRVLVILAPGNLAQQGFLQAIEAVAPTLAMQAIAAPASNADEIERAVEDFVHQPGGSLLVLPGAPALNYSDLIVGLAGKHRLPAMYTHRFFMERGGLMSYDTDIPDLYRRSAFYVDRILRGAKPGDLPVQFPTKYDLVVSLKVAKTLGLTIPLPLLATADEVIE